MLAFSRQTFEIAPCVRDHSRAKLAVRHMTATRMIFPAILLAPFLTASTGDSFTALYAFAGGAGYGTVFSLSLGSTGAPAP
jgi:hypothetical protein